MYLLSQLLLVLGLLSLFFYLRRRLKWTLLKRYESPLSGNIDVLRKYNGELVLRTNYFVQGVSIEQASITKSYWYAVARSILKHCDKKKNPTILFIGLGANTSSQLIHQKNPDIHQIIVEIDPLIKTACEEFFGLENLTNAEIIISDIYDQLTKQKQKWKKQFAVIVIDTFDAKPPYLLHGSHDPVFLNRLVPWLQHDGMFLFNIPVATRGIDVPSLLHYLKGKFTHVDHKIIRDPRGYTNHVIAASHLQ